MQYLIIISILLTIGSGLPCARRKYPNGYVCVCNATYCDNMNNMLPNKTGDIVVLSSSKGGLRFESTLGSFDSWTNRISELINIPDYIDEDNLPQYDESQKNEAEDASAVKIKIDAEKKFQEFLGFGGALTGAVSYNFDKISDRLKDFIYISYYSLNEGIGYTLMRTSIGGCDFDLNPWAYNEHPEHDKQLSNFTELDPRDQRIVLKINEIKQINDKIKLLGTAWSPPPWMKSNNAWTGLSKLRYEYYQTWANYHLKYLQLMAKENLTYWAITTGNEPLNGNLFVPFVHFMSLGWTYSDQARWIGEYLGPTLKNSKLKDIKILGGDDQRFIFPWWFEKMNILSNTTLGYLDGFAVHWYADLYVPPIVLKQTADRFPGKILLNTESCWGDKPGTHHGPILGSWNRGEIYIKAIMEDLNYEVNGWIDWNLILDEGGGPNYAKNYVSSPIIVNTTSGAEAYKQPMFYCIGHFSKYIIPGSIRIEAINDSDSVKNVAFLRPDGLTVVVIHNPKWERKIIFLQDNRYGTVTLDIPASSIHTLIY